MLTDANQAKHELGDAYRRQRNEHRAHEQDVNHADRHVLEQAGTRHALEERKKGVQRPPAASRTLDLGFGCLPDCFVVLQLLDLRTGPRTGSEPLARDPAASAAPAEAIPSLHHGPCTAAW